AARSLADDHVHAAIAKVLRLSVSLAAVAEDGDRLAFEEREISVVVVVDGRGHGGNLEWRIYELGFAGNGENCERTKKIAAELPSRHLLFFRFFLGMRLAVLAANHGDAAGTHKLEDAVGPHPLNERFDFVFAAGDFDHELGGTDIDNPRAKDLDE